MRAESGRTWVTIRLLRYPNLEKLAVYAGAKEVEVKARPLEHSAQVKNERITYTVGVTPQEIGIYYEALLAEYGWKLEQEASRSISVFGGNFSSSYSRPHASLSIRAYPQQDGQTRVEIDFIGYEISIH